jgi:flotillin
LQKTIFKKPHFMNKPSKIASLLAPAVALTIPFMPVDSKAITLDHGSPVMAVKAQSPAANSSVLPFLLTVGLATGSAAAFFAVACAFLFRRVVSTNMVHIVQGSKRTTAYGANLENGNVYYEVPSWVPKFGVSVIKLPVNNFEVSLKDYEAYDEDRVPFLVDVTAFFRISNSTIAAQRITDFSELKKQLQMIVQGAVRSVLGQSKIDSIMTQRSTFGESFSNEVNAELTQWGVEAIKNMELMDIRDTKDSRVISDIMAMKMSEIERNSRITVAENERLARVAEVENKRTAEISEVEAEREINLTRETAQQQIGERSAEREKAVGIAQEQAKQQVLTQQAKTKENDLAVRRVEEVREAEIERDRAVVEAEREQKVAAIAKQTALVQAAQTKETTILVAEGQLEAERSNAEAIQAKGIAEAEAEKAKQLAPVTAQITLAKEIGSNESYQKFLALVEAFKAYIAVGTEQAKSLQGADVRVIANGGSASEGVSNVMDLFSSKGGTGLAAAVEAFAQSDLGADLLGRLTNPKG